MDSVQCTQLHACKGNKLPNWFGKGKQQKQKILKNTEIDESGIHFVCENVKSCIFTATLRPLLIYTYQRASLAYAPNNGAE